MIYNICLPTDFLRSQLGERGEHGVEAGIGHKPKLAEVAGIGPITKLPLSEAGGVG